MRRCLAVVTVVVACHAPPSRAHDHAIPSSVPSAMAPVPVVFKDSLATDDSSEVVMGDYQPLRRLIELRRGMDGLGTWQVLFHERCHLTLADAGVHLGGETEEQVCDAWGVADARDFVLHDGHGLTE